MKAEKMKNRPEFALIGEKDDRCGKYMQMPTWLFYDPKYTDLSLDAKMIYTLLLNRLTLSQQNGWVNENGEVFLIYPRQSLAEMLHICEQRVSAAMRALIDAQLIWECRCGRGMPNQIYLAKVTVDEEGELMPDQESQDQPDLTGGSCPSGAADPAVQDLQILPPNKIDKNQLDLNYPDVSLSKAAPRDEGLTQTPPERELEDILSACELAYFPDDLALVFTSAIEQLYYSDHLRIGSATIPGPRVRAKLRHLDHMVLRTAEHKLRSNRCAPPKNSTGYIMAAVYNCITEQDSDLLVDPYLNSL